MIGKVFNNLKVIELNSSGAVNCLCVCGNVCTSTKYDVRNGRVKSCGCLRRKGTNTKHGSKVDGVIVVKEYNSWQGMRARCLNRNHPRYSDYGGRGINICPEWENFSTFLRDMGRKPSEKHSLERIDVNKGYNPLNCKWATPVEQARNKRKYRNNFSGTTGVGWVKRSKKWRSRITVKGNTILLGHFDSLDEAIQARKEAESIYF